MRIAAAKIAIQLYASSMRWAFGECGGGGAKPPFPADATAASASAAPTTQVRARSFRRTGSGILRDGYEMSFLGSVGEFRRTYGQSPYVLEAAPQAVPQERWRNSRAASCRRGSEVVTEGT